MFLVKPVVVKCFLSSYHPHHEVGEDSNPQGGSQEGDHEPAVPAWQNTVGHGAIQQEAQWPRDHPLHLRTAATCRAEAKSRHSVCSSNDLYLVFFNQLMWDSPHSVCAQD